ncbi:chemotaxis protein methyltransferase CheR [alpha proteobacterium U9-1i]|nr:chemotaxis protein methyltransferase CheR [alpha proteobacterium U9-1i]
MTNAATRARMSESVNLVEGEFPFTGADFEQIAKMLYADAGIHLQESKVALVYSRLAKRLRVLKLPDFAAYCAFVAGPQGKDERSAMLAALTTNVTRFFREPHHFDLLRDQVLTPLAAAARAGQRLRLWSAGCSTGQEPYSMAMTLLSVLPNAAQLDVRILASDIDPNVVATARAGEYNEEAVSPVPASLRDKYMKRDRTSGRWVANDELKSLIAFRELNLIGDWPMKGKFDAIFCRNVVIYFDDATQDRIWARFRALMQPHGRLYVGHSERVSDLAFDSDGLTAYRLKKGGAA